MPVITVQMESLPAGRRRAGLASILFRATSCTVPRANAKSSGETVFRSVVENAENCIETVVEPVLETGKNNRDTAVHTVVESAKSSVETVCANSTGAAPQFHSCSFGLLMQMDSLNGSGNFCSVSEGRMLPRKALRYSGPELDSGSFETES